MYLILTLCKMRLKLFDLWEHKSNGLLNVPPRIQEIKLDVYTFEITVILLFLHLYSKLFPNNN